jgi:hypothetical protein
VICPRWFSTTWWTDLRTFRGSRFFAGPSTKNAKSVWVCAVHVLFEGQRSRYFLS